jgi:predicted RNA binding protein with dsRBD fold (UPF0201 family)
MEEIILHVDAEVNPTESEAKVKEAIERIFGSVPLTSKQASRGSVLVTETHGKEPLVEFCNLLRREHIRAAARAILLGGIDRNAVGFCLNKQAAYAGHISFAGEVGESPLGPIRVRIESPNPHELINWLTSGT